MGYTTHNSSLEGQKTLVIYLTFKDYGSCMGKLRTYDPYTTYHSAITGFSRVSLQTNTLFEL